MCLSTDADRRPRTLMSIGMLCLSLSVGSQSLNLTFGLSPNPLHFLRGLLLGMSIAFNLHAVLLLRRGQRTS